MTERVRYVVKDDDGWSLDEGNATAYQFSTQKMAEHRAKTLSVCRFLFESYPDASKWEVLKCLKYPIVASSADSPLEQLARCI